LWQAERAARPSGELFADAGAVQLPARGRESTLENSLEPLRGAGAEQQRWGWGPSASERGCGDDTSAPHARQEKDNLDYSPLKPMTEAERLVADYEGTGLTIGRHPMALRRDELATRGVLRACDLRTARQGRRVRVAGMVITRQRPGTAKGFVFLTLEDETGVANIIVRPDLFARDRLVIVEAPFLLVDGVLQNQDDVVSVRAEEVQGLAGVDVDFDAHDFY